ncbi:hypothetical protein [Haloferula helveola]|uniref:hypothetical protein n=1 Tax=Haloferula helveola TaxID=490095 RepID=UPI00333FD7F3
MAFVILTPVSAGTSGSGSKAVVPELVEEKPEDVEKRWRLGLQYFQGTSNSLGEIFTGDIDTLPQNGVRLSAALVLVEDLWDWPVNVLAEGGVMWHNEKSAQSDVFQYTMAVRFEWTEFPWSDSLRTRLGFSTGLSYADGIPVAEIQNRGTNSSKHLLHYLEFSLAFNCADLTRITRLDSLGVSAASMEHLWLFAGIPHRSGAGGLYGSDNTGRSIRGGSNYLSIGIEVEF